MSRYEIEHTDGRWMVIDRTTGLALASPSEGRSTQLEAQALADFRNGIQKPTHDRVRTRLQSLRLVWKTIVSAGR